MGLHRLSESSDCILKNKNRTLWRDMFLIKEFTFPNVQSQAPFKVNLPSCSALILNPLQRDPSHLLLSPFLLCPRLGQPLIYLPLQWGLSLFGIFPNGGILQYVITAAELLSRSRVSLGFVCVTTHTRSFSVLLGGILPWTGLQAVTGIHQGSGT